MGGPRAGGSADDGGAGQLYGCTRARSTACCVGAMVSVGILWRAEHDKNQLAFLLFSCTFDLLVLKI